MDNEPTLNQSGIVLVVEDDHSLRSAIASALKVRGIDHLEFENAAEVSVVLRGDRSRSRPVCSSTSGSVRVPRG